MVAKMIFRHLQRVRITGTQRLFSRQPFTRPEIDENANCNLHFSHHHLLEPLTIARQGVATKCNACGGLITEPHHGCNSCNFYIHEQCQNLPRSLDHPGHPSHPLTLLPTPTYWSRSFICNACGSPGDAFSYCCAHCEFDVHTDCASHPTRIVIDEHQHELELIFDWSQHLEVELMHCDVCCGVLHKSFWIYYCFDCQFGTHLSCATRKDRENIIRRIQ